MADTLGHWLLQDKLPDDLKFEGAVTKGKLRTVMTEFAKRDPQQYVKVIQDVKRFGDEVATLEGLSVGLDDIAPDHKNRDKILSDAMVAVKGAKTDDAKRKIIYDTEDKIQKITEKHPSDMTVMARSGGRGSVAQLMKTVASPVAASAADGKAYPWLITHSYAQGLSPSETWLAGSEARRNAIASTGSVVEPGAVSKVVVSNMEDQVITKGDCDARAGLQKPTDSPNVVDRYLAKSAGTFSRNELLTPSVVAKLRKAGVKNVEVRSPMTCDVLDGVCQKCMGQDAWGNDSEIGMNVGSRSAQALTEPLTQFALNAKHGVRMVGGKGGRELRGLTGFRTLTEVPKSFTEKAALAKHDGTISLVEKAPQGGHNIFIGSTKHYTPPGLDPIVKSGDSVEHGDALSDGTPMPNEVVAAKGVGEGRRYLSDSLNKLYERQGVDIDHRHTELLARKAMNYVQIDNDPTDTLLEGDVVPFNKVKPLYRQNKKSMSTEKAGGKLLAEPVMHYSEGTRLTKSVLSTLKRNGVTHVDVATKTPEFTPIMKSIIQTPLLRDDWMSRMSHRYLKKTLVEGAGFGQVSDTASTNPVSAFVANPHFGHHADGKYAAETEKLAQGRTLKRLGKGVERAGEGVKNMLFGKGPDAVNARLAARKSQGDHGAVRVIGDSGNWDNAAHDARRIHHRHGDEIMRSLNATDEAGRVTVEGRRRLNAFDGAAGGRFLGMGRTKEMLDLSPHQKKELRRWGLDNTQAPTSDTLRRLDEAGLTQDIFSPEQLQKLRGGKVVTGDQIQKMRDVGISDDILNAETWSKIRENRGGFGSQVGKGLGKLTFGFSPLRTLRQRYETGGILGKGGILRGDLGASPDMMRAWSDFKDPAQGTLKPLGRTALWGGMDAMNKGFTYGLPAYVGGKALAERDPEGSRALNTATPLAEGAGWAASLPLGMVGGTLAAGQITNRTRDLVGKLDPKAREVLREESGDPPLPQQQHPGAGDVQRAQQSPAQYQQYPVQYQQYPAQHPPHGRYSPAGPPPGHRTLYE